MEQLTVVLCGISHLEMADARSRRMPVEEYPSGMEALLRDDLTVRFWGVRGSVPSPGPTTARYGGNTSCVSIEGVNIVDGKRRIGVLDAGTGIRQLARRYSTSTGTLSFC